MAGQGTSGLRILSQLPTVDTVVVPVGEGRLLAGVAACIKQVNPRVRVVGVRRRAPTPSGAASTRVKRVAPSASLLHRGRHRRQMPREKTVAQIMQYADDLVTVSDNNDISPPSLLLMERTKQIVEP